LPGSEAAAAPAAPPEGEGKETEVASPPESEEHETTETKQSSEPEIGRGGLVLSV